MGLLSRLPKQVPSGTTRTGGSTHEEDAAKRKTTNINGLILFTTPSFRTGGHPFSFYRKKFLSCL